eukprot:7383021-Prymnesium_polylepis.2
MSLHTFQATGENLCEATPSERLDRYVQREEGNTQEQRDKYTSLLIIVADQQHPPHQCELATQLKRLPQESRRLVIRPQKRRQMAQWSPHASIDCGASFPQQHSVRNRHPYWPDDQHPKGNFTGR